MDDLLYDDRFPFYVQIREWMVLQIAKNNYPEGGKIPSMRAIAEKHNANVQTVRTALAELVSMGYLRIMRGHGTYVADGALEKARNTSRTMLEYKLSSVVLIARMIMMKQGEVVDIVKAQFQKQLSEED